MSPASGSIAACHFSISARAARAVLPTTFLCEAGTRFVVALTDLGSVAVEHQRRQMDNSGSSGHRRLTTSSLPVSFASRRTFAAAAQYAHQNTARVKLPIIYTWPNVHFNYYPFSFCFLVCILFRNFALSPNLLVLVPLIALDIPEIDMGHFIFT